ncbi:hypothetical protein KSB_46360 [Ktedonobacter robiniae]|uniref:Uncharacterized protein n=1 Tax=Ktedonobacter robiniae TaxID=2778365 RepID=A0ABQ3UTZ0_9CHLR|nr:hypothetical protein KSB_46360 [Ktedonobacter robiniae]
MLVFSPHFPIDVMCELGNVVDGLSFSMETVCAQAPFVKCGKKTDLLSRGECQSKKPSRDIDLCGSLDDFPAIVHPNNLQKLKTI